MTAAVPPIRLAIHGAAGRMGKRLIALATADPTFQVVAALERPGHPSLGNDAGLEAGVPPIGVHLKTEIALEPAVDVLVDFSSAEGAERAIAVCRQKRLPLVMATTGLHAATQEALKQLACQVPVVWAPNMSLTVNLALKLVQQAAQVLRQVQTGVDVEIVERHHRFKEDAPSGTALKFGECIAAIMGQTQHVHGRYGQVGKRAADQIGYHALRVGDNVGEHTVVFGMLGETLEITVKASSRDCYAAGALQAARFAVGQPPGLYSMWDVLGLNS